MPARSTRFAPLAAAIALGATLTLSGCGGDDGSGGLSEVGEQIDQKTREGADQVEDAGQDAKDKAEDAAEKAGDKAEDAGDHTEHETDK